MQNYSWNTLTHFSEDSNEEGDLRPTQNKSQCLGLGLTDSSYIPQNQVPQSEVSLSKAAHPAPEPGALCTQAALSLASIAAFTTLYGEHCTTALNCPEPRWASLSSLALGKKWFKARP